MLAFEKKSVKGRKRGRGKKGETAKAVGHSIRGTKTRKK